MLLDTLQNNLNIINEALTDGADHIMAIAIENDVPPNLKKELLIQSRHEAQTAVALAMGYHFLRILQDSGIVDDVDLEHAEQHYPDNDQYLVHLKTHYRDNEKFVFQDVLQHTVYNIGQTYGSRDSTHDPAEAQAREDLQESFSSLNKLVTYIYDELPAEKIAYYETAAAFETAVDIRFVYQQDQDDKVGNNIFVAKMSRLMEYFSTNDFAMGPDDGLYPTDPMSLQTLDWLQNMIRTNEWRKELMKENSGGIIAHGDDDFARSLHPHEKVFSMPYPRYSEN